MFAIFETGGKQYKAVKGETLEVEKIDAKPGAKVDFNRVYLVADGDDVKVGAPVVDGSKVSAKIVEHGRGDKIRVVKFQAKKRQKSIQGHKQPFTKIEITGIAAK